MHASKAIRISVTLILAATAPSAFAKDGRVLFDQKVLRSDLTAVAEITSVASQGTNFQRGREYRSLANLKIIEGIKGCKTGDTVLLEYDNGLGCPNVLYSTGERCLVFACLMDKWALPHIQHVLRESPHRGRHEQRSGRRGLERKA
jgi:hypothetical protein